MFGEFLEEMSLFIPSLEVSGCRPTGSTRPPCWCAGRIRTEDQKKDSVHREIRTLVRVALSRNFKVSHVDKDAPPTPFESVSCSRYTS